MGGYIIYDISLLFIYLFFCYQNKKVLKKGLAQYYYFIGKRFSFLYNSRTFSHPSALELSPLLSLSLSLSLSVFPLLHVFGPYIKPSTPTPLNPKHHKLRKSLSLPFSRTHSKKSPIKHSRPTIPTMASSIALRRVAAPALLSKLFNPIRSISLAPSLSRSFNTNTQLSKFDDHDDVDRRSDQFITRRRGPAFFTGSCYLTPQFTNYLLLIFVVFWAFALLFNVISFLILGV